MTVRARTNPFYVLLVVVAIVFAITACCYGVMTLKNLDPVMARSSPSHGLLNFMDRHGVSALLAEVALLAILTFAAIFTDGFWSRP